MTQSDLQFKDNFLTALWSHVGADSKGLSGCCGSPEKEDGDLTGSGSRGGDLKGQNWMIHWNSG